MEEATPTNGRPGWRDVLHAVEQSEQRLTEKIDNNTEGLTLKIQDNQRLIKDVDERVKRQETEALFRERRNADLFRAGSAMRTFLLLAVALIGAGLGIFNALAA